MSDAISIKITKNNQLLQEKLKDLVNQEFVSKAEGELYKGLLILVKQLYGSMSGITSELSNSQDLTTKEYLQMVCDVLKQKTLEKENEALEFKQEDLSLEDQYLLMLTNIDIVGALDYYYEWS